MTDCHRHSSLSRSLTPTPTPTPAAAEIAFMRSKTLPILAVIAFTVTAISLLAPSSPTYTPPPPHHDQPSHSLPTPKKHSPPSPPAPTPPSPSYVLLGTTPPPSTVGQASFPRTEYDAVSSWEGKEVPFCIEPSKKHPKVEAYRGKRVCLPSYLIVGALKGGTSSLYAYLQSHPSVYSPLKKELCWFRFTRIPNSPAGDPEAYRLRLPLLPLNNSSALTGEGCPFYLPDFGVAQRVKELLPSVRLLLMLRHPVDRLYSMFNMRVRYRDDGFSGDERFEDYVFCNRGYHGDMQCSSHHQGTRDFIYESIYVHGLRRWIKTFPLSPQWIIGESEAFYADERGMMSQLFAHMGLAPFHVPDDLLRPMNADPRKGLHRMDPKLYAQLDEFYSPYSEELYALLGHDFHWHDTQRFDHPLFPFNELYTADGIPSDASYSSRDDVDYELQRPYSPLVFGRKPGNNKGGIFVRDPSKKSTRPWVFGRLQHDSMFNPFLPPQCTNDGDA